MSGKTRLRDVQVFCLWSHSLKSLKEFQKLKKNTTTHFKKTQGFFPLRGGYSIEPRVTLISFPRIPIKKIIEVGGICNGDSWGQWFFGQKKHKSEKGKCFDEHESKD